MNDEIPDFRFISSFEQNIEPKNSNYIYLVIACPNYKTVGLKIPNLVISNKSPYSFSHWYILILIGIPKERLYSFQ